MDLSPTQLHQLNDLLGRWGYPVIFAAMLLENAGVPLPGEAITLLGGYAAGSGHLHPGAVIASATAGAVLGDTIGYWVGRRYGWSLLLRAGRLLGRSPHDLEQLRSAFLKRAALSVVLGRFVAVLRVLAGPLAGASTMPYRQFALCNLAGALLWAGSMVSLAWFCGRWISLSTMLANLARLGLGALVLVLLLLVLPQLLERLAERFGDRSADSNWRR